MTPEITSSLWRYRKSPTTIAPPLPRLSNSLPPLATPLSTFLRRANLVLLQFCLPCSFLALSLPICRFSPVSHRYCFICSATVATPLFLFFFFRVVVCQVFSPDFICIFLSAPLFVFQQPCDRGRSVFEVPRRAGVPRRPTRARPTAIAIPTPPAGHTSRDPRNKLIVALRTKDISTQRHPPELAVPPPTSSSSLSPSPTSTTISSSSSPSSSSPSSSPLSLFSLSVPSSSPASSSTPSNRFSS